MNKFAEIRNLFVSGDFRLAGFFPARIGRRGVAKWPVLLAFAVLVLAPPARAFTINVTYDASVTNLANAAQVEAAFAAAAQTFQSLYTNPATANITVYWGNTGPFSGGIGLGASQTISLGVYTYADVTNALRAARASAADNSSVASLPSSDPTGSDNWFIPTAEVKGLGLPDLDPNDPTTDGSIGFASNQSYTFDPTNRAVAGKYDFIGVAEHEISEVLGRIYGLNRSGNGYRPYDLFRFTNNAARSFSLTATNVYFSVDNGATHSKSFYTNVSADIQDWATSTPPDAFDAFGTLGAMEALSVADVTALDVIGYNLRFIASPRLTGVTLTNGGFRFGFTNTPGAIFTVLAGTNLSLSLNGWIVLGAPTEGPAGQYQFTDLQSATNKQRFYRVRSP